MDNMKYFESYDSFTNVGVIKNNNDILKRFIEHIECDLTDIGREEIFDFAEYDHTDLSRGVIVVSRENVLARIKKFLKYLVNSNICGFTDNVNREILVWLLKDHIEWTE